MNPGEYQGLNINIILNTIIPSSILKKRYLTVEHSTHESIDANNAHPRKRRDATDCFIKLLCADITFSHSRILTQNFRTNKYPTSMWQTVLSLDLQINSYIPYLCSIDVLQTSTNMLKQCYKT